MTPKECEQIYKEAYRAVYWTAMALMKNEADAEDVNENKREADHKACERAVVGFLAGYAENGQNEDEGQQAFNEQTCYGTAIDTGETV